MSNYSFKHTVWERNVTNVCKPSPQRSANAHACDIQLRGGHYNQLWWCRLGQKGRRFGGREIMRGWWRHALLYIMLYLQHILGRELGGKHPTMGVSAIPWDLFSDRLMDKTDRWQTYRTFSKNVRTKQRWNTFLHYVVAELQQLTVIKSARQKPEHHITQQNSCNYGRRSNLIQLDTHLWPYASW